MKISIYISAFSFPPSSLCTAARAGAARTLGSLRHLAGVAERASSTKPEHKKEKQTLEEGSHFFLKQTRPTAPHCAPLRPGEGEVPGPYSGSVTLVL